jgi:hypothetical protein
MKHQLFLPLFSPSRQAKAFADIILAFAPVIASKRVTDESAVLGRPHRKRSIARRMAGAGTENLLADNLAAKNGPEGALVNAM